MRYEHSGDQPVYAPNSVRRPGRRGRRRPTLGRRRRDGACAYTLHAEDDDFGQPGTLVREVMDDAERGRLVETVASTLNGTGVRDEVKQRVFEYWRSVDKGGWATRSPSWSTVPGRGAARPGPGRRRPGHAGEQGRLTRDPRPCLERNAGGCGAGAGSMSTVTDTCAVPGFLDSAGDAARSPGSRWLAHRRCADWSPTGRRSGLTELTELSDGRTRVRAWRLWV